MKKKVRKNSFWVLLFLVIVLLCMTAPLYAVYSPTEVDLGSVLQKPDVVHWFGTDSSGRDVFTRTMYGGMVSLAVAASSSLCALWDRIWRNQRLCGRKTGYDHDEDC